MTILFIIPDWILAPGIVIITGIAIYKISNIIFREKPKQVKEEEDLTDISRPWTTFKSNGTSKKKVS